jgi:hypothetical protein
MGGDFFPNQGMTLFLRKEHDHTFALETGQKQHTGSWIKKPRGKK